MWVLAAGLVIFLGIHSLRIVSEAGRDRMVERLGEMRFKSGYAVLSLIGLVFLVYGYGLARVETVQLWVPPDALRHLALLLVPLSFILLVSAYLPTGRIKAWVAHPMVLGVALWALGHLLANGTGADLLLFGAFLAWALADYAAAYRRTGGKPPPLPGRPKGGAGVAHARKSIAGDLLAVVIGLALSAAFLGGLHLWLIGVSPLE